MAKRRGRKRRLGVPREAHGDVHREHREKPEDARIVAFRARERVYALRADHAEQPEAGNALGRLWLSGEINRDQLMAALEYEKRRRAYQRAIAAPGGFPLAGVLDRTGGHDGAEGDDESYVDQCNAARRAWSETDRALAETMETTRQWMLQYALNVWIIDNLEAWGYLPDLRTALNVLARLYRVAEWTGENAA